MGFCKKRTLKLLHMGNCSPGISSQEAVAPSRATAVLLQEGGRLLLEDGERLLEALDLRGPAALTLLVGLRLRNAALLDPGVVLQDGAELRVRRFALAAVLRHGLVQARELLRLVLHVLRLLSGEVLSEVRLHHLEDPDDAGARA